MTRLWTDDEWRAALSTAAINDLPDDAFAYIEDGGTKDESGKTTPRNLRHYPILDKAHADNALARADALITDDQADHDDRGIAEKALPAIKAAVKKFADATEQKAARWAAEHRDEVTYGALEDMLEAAITAKFSVGWADWYCWVCDFTSTWVVYSVQGQKFQVDYTLDGTTVTIADAPVMVVEEPNYVPMQVNSGRITNPVRNKKPRHRSGLPNGLEVRRFAAEDLELRDDSAANIFQLVGKPIQYNVGYQVRDIYGMFEETMHPGVVSDLLSGGKLDCRFLFNHAGLPLGRTLAGTLSLSDTPNYLESVVDLDPRQSLATDLAVAVDRGDVTQMSIGMIVGQDKWDAREEHRDIYKLNDLQDVSAVTYPASTTTDIAVAQRMLLEQPIESRDRVRRMWAISRDLRTLLPEDARADMDAYSDTFRLFTAADELIDDEPSERSESLDDEADRTSLLVDAVTFIEMAKRAAGSTPKWTHLADLRFAVIDALTELRANPTPQDKGIATKIKAAHQAVADAIHAQMGDSDNASDPVDAAVMDALQGAHKALGKATVAQSIDGAPDALRCASCQRDNTPDSSFCAGCGAPLNVGGPDGTVGNPQTGSGNDASGANDASGRTRMTTAELRRRDELERIKRSRAA